MTRPSRNRPRRDRGRLSRSHFSRRTPPPERTGLENSFLARLAESRQRLKIRLRTGEDIYGIVESFDRDTVEIRQEDGPTMVYRKTEIRYLEE